MSCPTPYVREINGYKVPVPCGRCLACRIDRRNMWTWRLLAEMSGKDAMFVTLTIDDDHMLYPATVKKASVQRFMKRIRRCINFPIKYYFVSEYGDPSNTLRPHYHGIIVGLSCGKPLTADVGDIPLVRENWPFGFVKCEPACKTNIRYVLKYLDKMQDDKSYKKLGLEPPFRLMSKGIGAEWIKSAKLMLNDDNCFYFDGAFRPLPRYYKDKLGLIDKYRVDYSDVSLFTRLKSSPKRFAACVSKYFKKTKSPAGFYMDLEEINSTLGEQQLLNLEKKQEYNKKL